MTDSKPHSPRSHLSVIIQNCLRSVEADELTHAQVETLLGAVASLGDQCLTIDGVRSISADLRAECLRMIPTLSRETIETVLADIMETEE